MDDGNGFIQGQTYNISEIEKKWYIDVVFSKHPLMIKLEWDSIKVYCKRIQLRNSFWDENCEYLLVLFFSDFTAIFVFNEQRISTFILICNSWGVTAGALTCVTSSFMLLYPLLLVINAHYKCITYLWFIHYWMTKPLIFGLIGCPLIPIFIYMWQDMNNLKFHPFIFHVLTFLLRWNFICPCDTCKVERSHLSSFPRTLPIKLFFLIFPFSLSFCFMFEHFDAIFSIASSLTC